MTDHNNMWFIDSSGTLNHCRFLHMETVLIVYLRARHCVTTNIDFWRKWNFSFLRAFPTALDIDIHYKTNLCPLLNVTGGPLAQLDETGVVWPESNQLSLFNLFIASHILHICSEYICVLYNRVCSFKHSPRSELCLGARASELCLACSLVITVPACNEA